MAVAVAAMNCISLLLAGAGGAATGGTTAAGAGGAGGDRGAGGAAAGVKSVFGGSSPVSSPLPRAGVAAVKRRTRSVHPPALAPALDGAGVSLVVARGLPPLLPGLPLPQCRDLRWDDMGGKEVSAPHSARATVAGMESLLTCFTRSDGRLGASLTDIKKGET